MNGDRATDFKWISWSIPAQVYTSSSIELLLQYTNLVVAAKKFFDYQQEADL